MELCEELGFFFEGDEKNVIKATNNFKEDWTMMTKILKTIVGF